jgi:hypothetical protein
VAKITVDFTGVESGGGFQHVPEGDYVFKVTKIKQGVGETSKKPYLLFSLKAIKGTKKGLNKTIAHNCSLQKNSLWNLRNLLEAGGKTVKSSAMNIDLDKLIGMEVGATCVDEEFEGKQKSVVATFFPAKEYQEESEVSSDTKALEQPDEEEDETTPEDEEETNDEEEELI